MFVFPEPVDPSQILQRLDRTCQLQHGHQYSPVLLSSSSTLASEKHWSSTSTMDTQSSTSTMDIQLTSNESQSWTNNVVMPVLSGPSSCNHLTSTKAASTKSTKAIFGTDKGGCKYRHRHFRQFLPDGEEKLRRTQELNKEACQVYRVRKKQKTTDMEQMEQQLKNKNQQLTEKCKGLEEQLAWCRDMYKTIVTKYPDSIQPDSIQRK